MQVDDRVIRRRDFLIGTTAGVLAGSLAGPRLFSQSIAQPICPKSAAPSRRLAVFDLRELTSNANDFRLTLCCLQGIVNRTQPRLYLIQDHYDELWLDWLRERGDIDGVEKLEIGHVFARFLPEVGAMYITDPAIPASVNVATMLAGIHSSLVTTPAIASQFDLPAGNYPDDSKVGYDLRRMHWRKDIDAYRWFFSAYESGMSKSAVSMLDPASAELRDYLVSFRIPILWISSIDDAAKNPQADCEEEKAFVRELFLRGRPNTPCLGWPGNGVGAEAGIGEWDGVLLGTECAKFEVCTGYDGYSPAVSNLSVHSGTRATLHQKPPSPIKLDNEKVYFSFTRSDGDGPNFLRHYYRKLFDDPDHGRVPLGWQIGATAFDTMPDILDFYYRHALPGDCFMNALTGVGYIHEDSFADALPESQREQVLREYVEISGRYAAQIDCTTMSTFEEMAPARLEELASIAGIRGVFANYGRTHATTMANLLTMASGRPVFRSVNTDISEGTVTIAGRHSAVESVVRSVVENTPVERPFLLHVFLSNGLITMDMAAEIAEKLGSGYTAVRPDQLVDLYHQWKGNHAS